MADPAPTPQELPRPNRPRFFWPGGLSARLLTLTILFAVLAGACAVPPALASFEAKWLLDRTRAGELASMAPDVAPDKKVSQQVATRLLDGAGVVRVAIQTEGMRRLVLGGPPLKRQAYLVDLRAQDQLSWLAAPFQTLFGGPDGYVRVIAKPGIYRNAEFVEIVAPDADLKSELRAYLWKLLLVAAVLTVGVGAVVYLSLNLFLVRPMQRITNAMERFRADPEDAAARVALSGRRDEIGRAEAELNRMQEDLLAALQSRARLAALGEAVAKINHDLRNMLTSARMASERLASSPDPRVAQAMPRLERALDRASRLAENVLAYGKSEEPAPQPTPLRLTAALEAAQEDAGLVEAGVTLGYEGPTDLMLMADADQVHRLLVNLLRNAREAIVAAGAPNGPGAVTVTGKTAGALAEITISDNGPGMPDRVRQRLFQPFSGSVRPEGAGLGLAISRELARGHGGELELADSGPGGTTFLLRLPLAQ